MDRIKEPITILAIGDKSDHDSYRKLHRQKSFILQSEFDYATIDYKRFFSEGAPPIRTEKVIIFLFFPFVYWNKYIEHRNYKGIYGNRAFFNKFSHFWKNVDKIIKDSLSGKKVFFINRPALCGLYRDKLKAAKKFSRSGILTPKIYNISRPKDAENVLQRGHNLFLKPRYGSMGKGITFLSWASWQTNLVFKNGRIENRHSDHGWKFKDITGNRKFLRSLLKKDILVEKAIDPLSLKNMNIDMRVYSFFNKIIYIYPRKNRNEKLTTNISQGGKGDPNILRELPDNMVKKVERLASNASRALKLNFGGFDIMIDRALKEIYVLDANVFPGFPRVRTFNLARCMIGELVKAAGKNRIKFKKIY